MDTNRGQGRPRGVPASTGGDQNAPDSRASTVAPPSAPTVEPEKRNGRRRMLVIYAISLVLGVGLWWFGSLVDGESGLLPPPTEVLDAAVAALADGSLLQNVWASLSRVLVGFLLGVLLAIPAGFLMGWFVWARGLFEPWVQFFRTVPPLALIPLVVLFLGIGETAKIFVIFLASFLATVIATFQGVRTADVTLINAARVLGASNWDVFLRVVVPASFPFILVGARIGLGSAWATLVAAELIAANSGLGQMMQLAALNFEVATIIVGIICIGVLGFVMDRSLLRLDERLTRWQEKRED